MTKSWTFVTALLLFAACTNYPEHSVVVNSTDALVETCYGTLCGYIEDGIYTFKGVRYAQADWYTMAVLMQQDPEGQT